MAEPGSPVRLINESALGVYVTSWHSGLGGRFTVLWDGTPGPPLVVRTEPDGQGRPSQPIRNPERFGWRTPRKMADFTAFVRRFAEQVEAD